VTTKKWLNNWLSDKAVKSQVAAVCTLPPRPAKHTDLMAPLHPRLQSRLAKIGLDRFYSHQAQAIEAALGGKDVAVVTGTNSGKTLCYNVPAMQWMLAEPMARALYIYPTKALAQDQLQKLAEIAPGPDIRTASYDGDTPTSQRPAIRKLANIVATNPNMLHVGILPGHQAWAAFFRSLRLIVIDEMHVYRGVFGSHVAGVFRRLLRLCEAYGSRPQIVACSATIGNPGELFFKLTGRRPLVVDDDGSPQGEKTFVFWNPPVEEDFTNIGGNLVSARILARMAESGLRAMVFCGSRIAAEMVLRYARKAVETNGNLDPAKLEAYRAGYSIEERREIEKALFKGQLLGLATTNAMELGVDIGGLDAVVLNGYPGTVASFWQQAGRAGRGTKDAVAVFVARDDPLEQFLLREPLRLLQADGEPVAINPFNKAILSAQLECAASELPLRPAELDAMGGPALAVAEQMEQQGTLEYRNGCFFYPCFEAPAPKVNIRGTGGETVKLMLGAKEVGTMEFWRALEYAHEGAVYLHRDAVYLVEKLDLDALFARLQPADVNYLTYPIVENVVESAGDALKRPLGPANAAFGSVFVASRVCGYRKKTMFGGRLIEEFELDLPAQSFETEGFWLELPPLADDQDASGLHGLEHALLAVAPLIAGCDPRDLGSAWYLFNPGTQAPAVFLYDKVPGGVGLAEKLFDGRKTLVSTALNLLQGCPCQDGCPGCLYSPRCQLRNELLDKRKALFLLRVLCGAQGL